MTHIKEDSKTESIDWSFFYKDVQQPSDWAHLVWALWHDSAENVPCSTCKPDAVEMISGIHDLKNIETGKYVFDYPKWEKFVARVEAAKAKNANLKHFVHHRLESPSHFDPQSFRIVHQGKDEVVIGCPVGHFKGGKCNVGTKAQAILHHRA